MRSTKIIVLKLKEIIYTAIFALLGILLILLLIFMFTNKKQDATPTMNYVPGVYRSCILLKNQSLDVEVVVDKDHISAVSLMNLNTATETIYPLLKPAMSNIESQLTTDIAFEDISIDSNYKYTSDVLLKAIDVALKKAKLK
jgi:uncharacterized protein with FMN-binding domain